jgi:glucose/mannose-6-phosphate isomerase
MSRLSKPLLDDFGRIRKIDKSDMLSFCVEAARHYRCAAELSRKVKIKYRRPKTIVVAGMGGSAIGGELLKDWAKDSIKTPIEVCRDYSLPAYADEDTLVCATSYSGETEETLSVFLEALKRKCMMITISSGGTLQRFAQELDVPHLLVPSGMAPRATLPYLFIPLPRILQKIGIAPSMQKEYSETVRILKQISEENSPEIPFASNPSKTLATEIQGTIPTIYGFGFYRAVAQRFKTQINENSKNPAKWEYLPELDHNEIVGWEEAKEFAKNFSIIFIRDKEEPREIKLRIETSRELISRTLTMLFEVWSKGKSKLARMASVICTGDFTSVYLAMLKGIDPTPVRSIDFLKRKLVKTGVRQKTIDGLEQLVREHHAR